MDLQLSEQLSERLRTLLGVGLCLSLSLCAALIFASRTSRVFVPLAFVVVIVGLALRYGAAVGIYGSLVAAAVFALFLFEPLHRFRIKDAAAHANVGWMLLAGISLSYLLASRPRTRHKKN